MPLEDPDTVMRQAQYQVCNDFIGKLKDGCPEVTAIITEYPKLVGVIKARDSVSCYRNYVCLVLFLNSFRKQCYHHPEFPLASRASTRSRLTQRNSWYEPACSAIFWSKSFKVAELKIYSQIQK